MVVINRQGKSIDYNTEKVRSAVIKASGEVLKANIISKIVKMVEHDISFHCEEHKSIDIEKVQDIIEENLMKIDPQIAKKYILYRERRKTTRENKNLFRLDSIIKDYTSQLDWRVNENSNVSYSLGGLILHNNSTVTANYWLTQIYPEEIAEAHKDGSMHIHDLGMLSAYCFTGDTRIKLLDGTTPTLKELSINYKDKEFYVLSKNKDNKLVVGTARNSRLTRKNSELVEVSFLSSQENCKIESVKCTPDHEYRLFDGSYKKAEDLKRGDKLSVLNMSENGGSSPKIDIDCRDITVDTVLFLNYKEDVYCISVDEYENFALANGVIVHNCSGWSLRHLIMEGLSGVEGKLSSKPAKHLNTLINQMVNFLGVLQNEWSGAQAFSSVDTYLAPFIKYDNLSYKGVKQAIQSLMFGLNTPSRWGCQSPFTNFTFDLSCPDDLKDQPVIIGGKSWGDYTYKDFQNEMNMINKAFVELFMEGDSNGRCFSYPIPTYNITNNFNWDDPFFQDICELTGKYGTPYFQNFVNSDLNPSDVRSMCVTSETKIKIQWNDGKKEEVEIGYLLENYTVDEFKVLTSMGYKSCTERFIYNTKEIVKIVTGSGKTLEMTPDHPALVYGNENNLVKILAKDLEKDMVVPVYGNIKDKLVSVEKIDKKCKMYDVEMLDEKGEKEAHYFYVNDILTHNCCRLQLDKRELKKRGGGLFGADEFTGSIGVVTVNLPRIGYITKNEGDYIKEIDRVLNLAKNSLEIKKKTIVKLSSQGMYPYTSRYLRHWNNHFLTIGVIGMEESCQNFMQKSITTKEGREFSLRVLEHIRSKIKEFQELSEANMFNLEATPGEGTSYRLAKIDKAKYSDCYTSGGDKPYYTNSTCLPVGFTEDIFEVLDHQEELQRKYTGGTVVHLFLGERTSAEIVKNLVKKVTSNYKIPYFTVTPTFSVCKNHGYISGKVSPCPTCNEETEVYSRIVGYYRPVKQWNIGKKEEFKQRKTFKV